MEEKPRKETGMAGEVVRKPKDVFYQLNVYVCSNSYTETLNPSVAIFGDVTSQ